MPLSLSVEVVSYTRYTRERFHLVYFLCGCCYLFTRNIKFCFRYYIDACDTFNISINCLLFKCICIVSLICYEHAEYVRKFSTDCE
jgi:hypothetical protein